MWKLIIGFVLFAVVSVFVLMQAGDIDMGGEKHGIESHAEPAAAASAPAAAASTP
jgi:hypothetical protein